VNATHLETRIYVHSHGEPELVRTEARPGWNAAKLQKAHTDAVIGRLNQRRREQLDARYADILAHAEVANWGQPEGWPDDPEMREYRKSKHLAQQESWYAACVDAIDSLHPLKTRPLLRPFPKVTYKDRSQEIAAKYEGVTFEHIEQH
jgi:hypothetical protein